MSFRVTAWLVDSWTVAHKELKESLTATITSPKSLSACIGLLVVSGILAPWYIGSEGYGQAVLLLITILLPIPLVIKSAADSFAGERERHTLETLLASRLPIQAILVGKVMAASLFGWSGALIALIAGLITVRAAPLNLEPVLFSPQLIVLSLALSFLISLFTACTGAYISHRTTSIYQAQLSIGLLLGLLVFVTLLLSTVLMQLVPMPLLLHVEPERLAVALAGLGAGMFVVDLALYIATSLRFKRRLLITES